MLSIGCYTRLITVRAFSHSKQFKWDWTVTLILFYLFITIYSIQYKYIKEIKITKQTKSCGEGDNQKRKSTILGMSPLIKI